MTLLLGVWYVTLFLAAFSLLLMGGLIVQRRSRNHRARRDAERRQSLKRMALTLLAEPAKLEDWKGRLGPDDRRLLQQLFLELSEKIKGEDGERLVSLMRILGVMQESVDKLASPNWWDRQAACVILGRFRDPNVILALYRALEDPHGEVRIAAAQSLVRLKAVRLVDDLVRNLVTEDDTPSLAVTALFRSLPRELSPQLTALVQSDVRTAVKIVAVDALGHSGDPDVVPILNALGEHPNRTLRLAAMQALTRLADRRSLTAALTGLQDPAWEVRAQAAECAALLRAEQAVPLLGNLMADEQWWVRYHAAQALFKLGAGGLNTLRRAAESENPRVVEMARGFLQEKGLAA